MIHTFSITLANKPAVLERLLRVTRHRGFTLQSLNVESEDDNLQVRLLVNSEKPACQLYNQLDKLFDVKNIEQQ